jgi:DNA-binding NarL/FixJ family response regulator
MLEQLAEAIGEEAALRLLEARGGTRVYIPHQPKASDALASSIGLPAAIGLSQIYGGDRLEVPNPTPRKVRVLELRSHGLSIDAIAHQLGCTRRRVFQVLADAHAGRRGNAERTHGS